MHLGATNDDYGRVEELEPLPTSSNIEAHIGPELWSKCGRRFVATVPKFRRQAWRSYTNVSRYCNRSPFMNACASL